MLSIFLMFEIFLVSSWDISHSQFGIPNQILVSRGYRDTATSFWDLPAQIETSVSRKVGRKLSYIFCICSSWLGLIILVYKFPLHKFHLQYNQILFNQLICEMPTEKS